MLKITNLATGETLQPTVGLALIDGQNTLKEGFLYLVEATDVETAVEYERVVNVLPDAVGDFFDARLEAHNLDWVQALTDVVMEYGVSDVRRLAWLLGFPAIRGGDDVIRLLEERRGDAVVSSALRLERPPTWQSAEGQLMDAYRRAGREGDIAQALEALDGVGGDDEGLEAYADATQTEAFYAEEYNIPDKPNPLPWPVQLDHGEGVEALRAEFLEIAVKLHQADTGNGHKTRRAVAIVRALPGWHDREAMLYTLQMRRFSRRFCAVVLSRDADVNDRRQTLLQAYYFAIMHDHIRPRLTPLQEDLAFYPTMLKAAMTEVFRRGLYEAELDEMIDLEFAGLKNPHEQSEAYDWLVAKPIVAEMETEWMAHVEREAANVLSPYEPCMRSVAFERAFWSALGRKHSVQRAFLEGKVAYARLLGYVGGVEAFVMLDRTPYRKANGTLDMSAYRTRIGRCFTRSSPAAYQEFMLWRAMRGEMQKAGSYRQTGAEARALWEADPDAFARRLPRFLAVFRPPAAAQHAAA